MLGLIGKKIGMTQVFDDWGELTAVTAIKVDENIIIGERTVEKNGYSAYIIGSTDTKEKRLTKAVRGQFKEGMGYKRHLLEFRDFGKEMKPGDSFGVEILEGIEYVDVIGTSKGKGYQGTIKRFNFSGGSKTHGSKFHRGMGGTAMATDPAHVYKGTKMPGRMGNERKTSQSLRIVKIDTEKQILLVKGSVPGPRNCLVMVKKAKKM